MSAATGACLGSSGVGSSCGAGSPRFRCCAANGANPAQQGFCSVDTGARVSTQGPGHNCRHGAPRTRGFGFRASSLRPCSVRELVAPAAHLPTRGRPDRHCWLAVHVTRRLRPGPTPATLHGLRQLQRSHAPQESCATQRRCRTAARAGPLAGDGNSAASGSCCTLHCTVGTQTSTWRQAWGGRDEARATAFT
jgi:hypothetical protein